MNLRTVFLAFTALWILSYSFYNSLGFDISYPISNGTHTTHYRVRLPGNGSLWVGKISREYTSTGITQTEFDFGGAFFQPSNFPTTQTSWQWLGFWWIDKHASLSEHPDSPGLLDVQENWVGVPVWSFLIAGVAWRAVKHKKQDPDHARYNLPI